MTCDRAMHAGAEIGGRLDNIELHLVPGAFCAPKSVDLLSCLERTSVFIVKIFDGMLINYRS